jgi:ppGpp synthetase/RelA/SpoT-type nucleotidyltranferase
VPGVCRARRLRDPDGHRRVQDGVTFFELQVKTAFWHAWSEADHDVGYKPTQELTPDQNRMAAFNAQASWALAERVVELESFEEVGYGSRCTLRKARMHVG